MKNKKLLILDIILVIALIVVMAIVLLINLKSDSVKFKEEYESLNDTNIVMNIKENNPIEYLNIKEVFELFENGTGVIYFGFPGCPWCRNMIPILFESASINNIDKVYYFNPREIRNANSDDYTRLIEILKDYLEEDENHEKKLYVPDVYFIKDGKIVGNHLGTVSSQTNPKIELTEEQKQELLDIYNNLFSLIK